MNDLQFVYVIRKFRIVSYIV